MQSFNLALCVPLFLAISSGMSALQAAETVATTVTLWTGSAPGALGNEPADQPTLTLFPAAAANRVRTGVIVCPGGSYLGLASTYEGNDVAAWFNKMGISAFVLKYRLGPRYHHPVELGDAQRAIRYVRAHASDYGVAANHIGVMGFSAGGHLAATAGTHFDAGLSDAADPIDRQSSRPDFLVLAYPVITMQDPYAHVRSRAALLGEQPNPALVNSLSNELQVTTNTPPTFLFHTTDDAVVPVENSVHFYLALRRAGVPAELHVYLHGKHGVGLAPTDPVLHTWPEHLAAWLRVSGFR